MQDILNKTKHNYATDAAHDQENTIPSRLTITKQMCFIMVSLDRNYSLIPSARKLDMET